MAFMPLPRSLTLAVTYPGDPTDPRQWSGTPAGLIRGLSKAGVTVVPVDVTPPGPVARVWTRAVTPRLRPTSEELLTLGRESAAYARAVGATALARVPRSVDGVLQIGSGYRVRHRHVATFEDMTVAQAVRHSWGPFAHLPPAVADGRRRLQQSVYAAADVCFAATSWTARSIEDDYGIPAARVHVTGLGVNREVGDVTERDWDVPVFLFVGHDWERKRGDAVVRAFGAVRHRHPEAQLHLVGAGVPAVQQDGVIPHGALPMSDPDAQRRLADLFRRATCLVVPSRLEPAGIVYAEAGSMGIPSIGTTVGGAPDMIGPGGTVVSPENDEALMDAMVALSEPGAARAAGQRARDHAASLTWEAVGARIADRWAKGISGTRAAAR